ncbi:MAG: right-handed parallel beta-helix repeat-containing protein [Methanomassiliicoccales archaeon]|nr:right-handed parallel beta-helix repeat-containing protein [Methanomassiliicoccales archaeon]
MGQAMMGQRTSAAHTRCAIFFLAALLLLPVISLPTSAISSAPIVVEGDGRFTAAGFSGTGAVDDPFVLSGAQIDATNKFHGIYIANTSAHFRIEDCVVTDAYTPSIEDREILNIQASGSGIILFNVSNGTIVNFQAEYNVRGVTVANCTDVTVSASRFYNNVIAGVHLSNSVGDGVVVSNCTFTNDMAAHIDSAGVLVEECHEVIVRDNTVTECIVGISMTALSGPCTNNLIANNLVRDQAQHGILLTGSAQNSENIVSDNQISGVSNGDGIYLEKGTLEQLVSNDVRGCLQAIRLGGGADQNTIARNLLSNNTYGVRSDSGADQNSVVDNSIHDGTYGVFISPSQGNLVSNNTIMRMNKGSAPVGIYLGVGAVRNAALTGNEIIDCGVGIRAAATNVEQRVGELSVTGNTVSGSLKQGMYLVQVNDSQIVGNIFESNALEGIYLVSGSGNEIYDNAFLFNKGSGRVYSTIRAQAYCGEVQNDWYLEAGNLWADWLVPDENEDGVVDVPYLIPTGCQDPFPLTSIPGLNITDDLIPPEVIDHSPQGQGVDRESAINMTFSEDMDQGSVIVLVNDIAKAGVWGDRTFSLNMTLEFETEYQIKVQGRDLAGNNMSEFSWTFSTEGPNATLSGRLVDEEGNGIEGVSVTIGNTSVITGGDGVFSSELAPGNYTLLVSPEGYLARSIDLQILPGQDIDLGDVTLVPVPEGTSDPPWIVIGGMVLIGSALVFIFAILLRRRR